jgi:ABC-type glutathione transport system ATPase component
MAWRRRPQAVVAAWRLSARAQPMTATSNGHAEPPGPAAPLLAVRNVALRFGGIVALDGVSFTLERGSILGLIGPNGAGKTTLFNCLSRLYTPDNGDILFEGRSLLAHAPHRIAEIGIARTFQNLALFEYQSVLDNILIGAHGRTRSDFVSDALRLPAVRRQERALREAARRLLDLLDLRELEDRSLVIQRLLGLLHFCSGGLHGFEKFHVPRASAKNSAHRPLNIVIRWIWLLVEQTLSGEDHSGDAIPALSGVPLHECSLNGMKILWGTYALYGCDLLASSLYCQD